MTAVYLALVGFITLGPQPLHGQGDTLLRRVLDRFADTEYTSWITYSRVEFGANVMMFLPVGLFFLLLFGRRRWWLAIIASIVLTGAIEFTQLFLPTRVSDPRDLLSNTIGGTIGVLLGLALTLGKARQLRLSAENTRLRAEVSRLRRPQR